ncbi:Uncharacterized protein Adt_21101 [Abeliophyllum distichum]|uniref:Hydroxyproline-rich glycoprotein family protein n=1 Tax=Abeliophyllum distichum TaxID=126358 RepID=A0ABD1SYD3_9LAMI
MKSLGKLRSFALHKSESKDNWDHQISANKNGLAQATKDMKDMRTCYDSLLSAAAATTNSAYEFSESLLEMGNCLLDKTALDDGGESGRALLMLGRVQLELHKLVDSYRSHIMLTITNPSESLLTELRKVEEMKLQCDEKREMLEHMVTQYREKGKSRLGKGENFPSQQLQAVREEYDEAARLCVFRVESLKQGQCRSLLTQAARHHTAQLNFFRKALLSLESIEQHIQVVAEKQHIDCQLYGLDDGEDGDNERNSFKTNYDGKLSFNYTQNKQETDNVFTLGNSTEINLVKRQGERITSRQSRAGSHSAPIFEEKFDHSERIGETQTSIQKQNTHVLPTPADARSSSSGTSSSTILSSTSSLDGRPKNSWHTSPLDTEKHIKSTDDNLFAHNFPKAQIAVKENNSLFVPLPPPFAEGVALPQSDTHTGSDTQKIKRQAFSGPLASKASSNKHMLSTSGGPIGNTELPQQTSGLLFRVPTRQQPSSLNVPSSASPPLISSPKISELHELPKPPDSLLPKPSGVPGYSVPLVSRNRAVSPTNRNPLLASKVASPLPPPPLYFSRSLSIPADGQREIPLHGGKLLESSEIKDETGTVCSPPLTPLSLSNIPSSDSGEIRDDERTKDHKVKQHYLYQAIDKVIFKQILDKHNTKVVWDTLKRKFGRNALVKRSLLQDLRRDFEVLEMKKSETITEYFTRVIAVANKIRNNGETMPDSKVVEKILGTLTERFTYVVVSIEESKDTDTFSIDELQSSLVVHEQKFHTLN